MTKQEIDISSPFTAPSDGIIRLYISANAIGRFYISTSLFMIDLYAPVAGSNAIHCFPIMKGEILYTSDISNAYIRSVYFYTFES